MDYLPAGGLAALEGAGALVAALAAVVNILGEIRLAAVVPLAVAVAPPGLARVLAVAVVAPRHGVRHVLALDAAAAAVVDVGGDARLAAVLVRVAVLEAGRASSPRMRTPCTF